MFPNNNIKTLKLNIQSAETKYGIIFKTFFNRLISAIIGKKKHDKSKFLGLTLLLNLFFIKIQPEKRNDKKIYDLLNGESKPRKISEIIRVSLCPH